jgi:hypothetical protein
MADSPSIFEGLKWFKNLGKTWEKLGNKSEIVDRFTIIMYHKS